MKKTELIFTNNIGIIGFSSELAKAISFLQFADKLYLVVIL
jgi:hypothetical protein